MNLSNNLRQEYLADEITDDLINDLSQIPGGFVTARNTAFTYKGKSVDVRQVGRELGVRYVLEGSVHGTNAQSYINVRLLDAENGTHLWSGRFESDLNANTQALSDRVFRMLGLALLEDVGRRIEREKSTHLSIPDLLMRARALLSRPWSPEILRKAQNDYELVIEKDSDSIDAKIGIASALLTRISAGWRNPDPETLLRAEKLLLDAIDRDGNRASTHTTMGLLRRLQDRLPESLIELEVAKDLDAKNINATILYGKTLLHQAQPEAAIIHIEKGIQRFPFGVEVSGAQLALALCHFFIGDVDKTVDLSLRSLARNRWFYFSHLTLAAALVFKGNLDQAKLSLVEATKLRPDLNSLSAVRALVPYRNPEYVDLIIEKHLHALQIAGLPENQIS
jgi:TolB-like protein/Tfp pilus assembly protein PilF